MPRTHTLRHPLTLGKTTLEKLSFRDHATANDLLAFDRGGPTEQTINLIANLTGTDVAIIGQLHVADFRACDAIASELVKPEDLSEKNSPAS